MIGMTPLSYTAQICDGARVMSFRTATSFVFANPHKPVNFIYVRTVVQAVHGNCKCP